MDQHLFLNIIPNNFFHGWNGTENLVWSGHESKPLSLKTHNIHGLKIMEVSLVSLANATV